MAISNAERVGKALELLNQGLFPFMKRELKAFYGDTWFEQASANLREYQMPGRGIGDEHWDTQALLLVMWDQWNTVFRNVLGQAERSLVSELRDVRNKWAHQEPFSTDDAYRALDSVQRLLSSASAADQATEVERQKQELLRIRFEEQARKEVRKAAVAPIEGQPAGGLRPWREVVTPHPDVASGRFQQAEFAADLGQVVRYEGADEYRHPREFFQRTYLTEGLRHLLTNALRRLETNAGDPVVELLTNFGGGKTHSLLALYHLASGVPVNDLPGIEPLLQTAGVSKPPLAQRAVLVGTALSPGQAHTKSDGTVVRTLWGDLAWQLLGKDGYALVAEADRQGVSPGSDILRQLFAAASPCLILIDEWVAYMRQLYGVSGLPAGSFDANLSFAQALTEAAKAAPKTLLVASIPASDIEIGGEGGREAVVRLRNTFGRLESTWRPASAEEGFEIVRRRLFQPITQQKDFTARDAVARAFTDLYRTQSQEFPSDSREGDYERRLKAAYPIHPELFDRLYNDWSQLDRFQRTRGVLRLMAAVIHTLWERQDASLLILPASVPIDDPLVQYELTRYLEDPWTPIIERDVDGANSLPLRLDREHPNLGRYSATRRVARTIYLGSAPTLHTANRGIEEQRIKLGCVQPGESVPIFGDALHRLTEQANHLYVQDKRYWYSTQPSVIHLAQDRVTHFERDVVLALIEQRLRAEQGTRGSFVRIHICPTSSGEVPDERDARLVILRPAHVHAAKDVGSPARTEAAAILEQRGTSPRYYANTLIFLAADRTRCEELEQAARQYLAWKSIEDEQEILNLDAFQRNQARARREHAEGTVKARIPETYCWLLVPEPSEDGATGAKVSWREIRLQPVQEALAVRASRKLENDGLLITKYAGTNLRLELDKVPLWRGEAVSVKQLADDFAQYLYLPRLRDTDVILAAVRDGVAALTWERETFAYADSYDATRHRYLGLKTGQQIMPSLEGLLVKPEFVTAQIAADRTSTPQPVVSNFTYDQGGVSKADQHQLVADGKSTMSGTAQISSATSQAQPQRFYGSVTLDTTRAVRDATAVIEEVAQHLNGLLGARVEITMEIHAELPEGTPEHVVRTVTENCRTLKFTNYGFENEG
jgi:predicted AAA+ superfamily ATPase